MMSTSNDSRLGAAGGDSGSAPTPGQDLPARFRQAAAASPDRTAICADSGAWTYAALNDASDALAAALRARSIDAGDRVALYCPNGTDFVVAYLGILKAGAVVVPVNLLLSPREIAFQLRDAGARALLFHAAVSDKAAVAVADAPDLALRVVIGAERPGGSTDCRLEDLLSPAQPPTVARDPERDAAVILYTSGTTGRPKGAVLTHRNLASNADAVREALGLQPETDRFLVVLPMFHAFAGTVGILTPLLAGAALVPVAGFDPQAISAAIEAHRATIFLGVPSLYAVLMRLDDRQVGRWRSIRLGISGGAAMPEALMQRFEARFGVPILEGDGPTECGPVTAVNRPEGPRKPGSIGPPIPGVEMRIADPTGNWLRDGEHGEVCVRGPSVMQGYWHLPAETQQSFFGDWFRTGDLGWRDADGFFYLVDRIKDLIITNGINVYPRVVEEALIRHPAVAEAAVVGEPHPLHGEIPIAYVSPASQGALSGPELRAWCREQLGSHEIPRRIEIVEALPKNAAGKILKRELRRGGEHERGVDRPTS
ncbi:MAG: long-chain fatty acid--CoA ligase [Thiohalocapsa sp.]|jgi:long-chain acyl-CoA synthetase